MTAKKEAPDASAGNKVTRAQKPARTLADFRATHDPDVVYPARIRKALDEMRAEHRESWAYEIEFLPRAGVSNSLIAQYRDAFAAHIVETRGKSVKRVWFADVTVAKKARGDE